jgi:hypothetical protein
MSRYDIETRRAQHAGVWRSSEKVALEEFGINEELFFSWAHYLRR